MENVNLFACFETYGPFELPNPIPKALDEKWKSPFWDEAEDHSHEERNTLRRGVGCYAFCLKSGEKIKPWYVGKTNAKSGFCGEVFQAHKIDHYSKIYTKRRGTGVLFLFPLMTPKWKFSRPGSSKDLSINWLEKRL